MEKKKILIVLTLLLATVSGWAQGMVFEPQGTLFQDAVKKARQTGKMIFVDCYTSWCGPCKMMARDVFPTDSAGQFMNPRFVNLQIDMEKGEGSQLKETWQVGAFPTFIIFDANGVEMNRFLGSSTTTEFLKKVEKSISDTSFSKLEQRFQQGDRSREFLLSYVDALGRAQKARQASDVTELLLEGKTETFANDKELAGVFMKHLINPFHPAFIYVAKTPAVLEAAVGNAQIVRAKLDNVWSRYPLTLEQRQDGKVTVDEEGFARWEALLKECGVENREELVLNARIRLAQDKQDWAEYIKYIREYWDNPQLDVADMQLMRWSSPFAHDCKDAEAKAALILLMQQRIDDLENGRRAPQTKMGNMTLGGEMKENLKRLVKMMTEADKKAEENQEKETVAPMMLIQ